MSKTAIFMPKPQLCGPGTWCRYLRSGFLNIGEECDVVTFTKSGKPRASFGRIQQYKGSDANCTLLPDVVGDSSMTYEVLDKYDLIVLDQVKTAYQDKKAIDRGDDPFYIESLAMTDVPFCSALHGKYYWESHETPKGRRPIQGTPFIRDLLSLSNFTGFLLDHARDFDSNCEILRKLAPAENRAKLALPYRLNVTDDWAMKTEQRQYTIGCNGRITGAKNRGLIWRALNTIGAKGSVVFRGASSVTNSACEAYLIYKRMHDIGYRGWREETNADTGLGPVQRPLPWTVEKEGLRFEFNGAFDSVWKGFGDMQVHLSVTDCGFSGGLLEFSTLEAMDAGCICIITKEFLPDYPLTTGPFGSVGDSSVGPPPGIVVMDIGVEFGESKKFQEESGELFCEQLARALDEAACMYSDPNRRRELVAANREWIRKHCDPKQHAAAILEGVARCESNRTAQQATILDQ